MHEFRVCCGLMVVDFASILRGYFTGTGAILYDLPNYPEEGA